MSLKKILFLSSSRGSNVKKILEEIQSEFIPAQAIGLITDNPDAGVISIAKSFSLPFYVIPYSKEAKSEYHSSLLQLSMELKPDLIVCAGYFRILDSNFVRKYPNSIVNIHPSLLPAFPGMNSGKKAWDYGVKIAGCTVHFIDEGLDTGPIIMQSPVEITNDMTEDEFMERIHKEEHRIYPLSIKYFCENKIQVNQRKVSIISAV